MASIDSILERVVRLVEGAAGLFLAFIAALTFVSVLCRYVFHTVIPDGFDIGRLMLGVAVFWGIAGAACRNDHIRVDVLWAMLPRAYRRIMDLFAMAATLAGLSVLALMSFRHVLSAQASNQTTFDLQLPLWPFYGVAWLGIALAVLLLFVRIFRPLDSE